MNCMNELHKDPLASRWPGLGPVWDAALAEKEDERTGPQTSSMKSDLYQFQKRQIALIARVTPYAMAGHLANTMVIAMALASSVRPAPLIIWCAYSCATALFLLYRHVKNRRHSPRSFLRAIKKATIYAFLLALPWSSLAVLYLGSLSHGEELLLVALGIGMAACGTVLLSAIPPAAFSYMSVILLPSALKYLLLGQKGYVLLGTLALSYWGCLAALIAKTSRDIRDRQVSELALAERNAQIALAGTAALVGSYGYDVGSGKMQVSAGYAAIHGLPEGTTNTARREWRERLHPEDAGRLDELRSQAFKQRRREYNVEYRIVLPGRGVRWIESRSLITYDCDGNARRVTGVNIDVTNRKRTEVALQASEAKFAGILAIAGDAIVSIDADHRITLFNEAAEKVYGYSQAEILGQPIDLLMPTRFRAEHQRRIEQFASALEIAGHASERREVMGLRKNGEEFPAEASISKLYVGGERYYTVVLRDISERKRAELALAERNTQFELASKTARVGSFSIDFATGIVKLTPGCAAIYGLPEGTLEASRDDVRKYVHPADWPQVEAQRNQAFLAQQRDFVAQCRIFRAGDGEVRWLELRCLIFYTPAGKPSHMIGVNIDITERKQAEALLRESQARLADALAAGQVMAFEWDAVTGRSRRSENAVDILGRQQDEVATSPHGNFLGHVHTDDRKILKRHIGNLSPGNPSYTLNFRYVCPDGRELWLDETAKGDFDATGKLLRIKGLTRDITHGKQAEQALAERNAQLALAGRAALVGSYAYDVNRGVMHVSEGYAAIHGLPEGTTETSYNKWRARVHPEDLGRAEALRSQAFTDRRKEDNAEYRIVLSTGEVRWIEQRGSISYGEDGRPERVVGVNIDVTERKRAEQHQRALNAELDHRVKNVLATVSAIISQTHEASRTPADFVVGLNRRIKSLAGTHELLSRSHWHGVPLAEIIRRELAPYGTTNTDIRGPDVTLKAEATQAVATVLHELTTNAAKYGAFSNRTGRVSVQWQWLNNGSQDRLIFEWQELGGPPVLAPSQPGYGTSIIRDLIPFELGGKVELLFATEGIRCRLEVPADWINRERPLGAELAVLRAAQAVART
jgi:PAS domain S-box-containing protein